jgi:hypothetical protein
MDAITQYRVTELDLYSAEDLTDLAAALGARGLPLLQRVDGDVVSWIKHQTDLTRRSSDGSGEEWLYQFSLRSCEYVEPEPEIAAMLAAVEALDPLQRSAWERCSLRVFDIAYDCGSEPQALHHGLSAELLARLAAVGGTLRFTLYSDPETSPAEPCAAPDPAAD